MDLFCRIISIENAAKFPFFCRNLSEALIINNEYSLHFIYMTMQFVLSSSVLITLSAPKLYLYGTLITTV